ncbi:MAG: hypothetical protein FJW61_06770 [Actinobacteria bacterium]|nr:hypothetical protein [Actinomycetota bacterium]
MFRRIIKYSNRHFGLFKKISSISDRRIKPQIATVKILASIVCIHMANLGSLHSFSQSSSRKTFPSVSTIARVADTISLNAIRDVGAYVYKRARKQKMLAPYQGMWIGIIDGHEMTTSDYCKCSYCRRRNVSKIEGVVKYQYYHSFTAFMLAGGKYSFILDIEPIAPGESEVTSSYRLLERVCKNYPKAFSTVIGDALYLNEKIFKLLESHHKYSIAVLKEERRQLFEEANKLSLLVEPIVYKDKKTTYRVWDHSISGCWDGYGRDVRVIVSEETTTKRVHSADGAGWEEKTQVANWMWVTNLPGTDKAIDSIGDLKNTVKVCHSRWQIENRCFNETAGTWNADHIYRHSANAIIAILLLLFICVNIFNIFLKRNIKDKKVKTKVFLISKIKAEFLSLKRLSPLIPIPI